MPKRCWGGTPKDAEAVQEAAKPPVTGAWKAPFPSDARQDAEAVLHSMPRGPWASPERNCRTNWFGELNSSDAGPDSTIRPFQRTAM